MDLAGSATFYFCYYCCSFAFVLMREGVSWMRQYFKYFPGIHPWNLHNNLIGRYYDHVHLPGEKAEAQRVSIK